MWPMNRTDVADVADVDVQVKDGTLNLERAEANAHLTETYGDLRALLSACLLAKRHCDVDCISDGLLDRVRGTLMEVDKANG